MKIVNELVKTRLNSLYDELETLERRTEEGYNIYLNRLNDERVLEVEIAELKAYLDSQQIPYSRHML